MSIGKVLRVVVVLGIMMAGITFIVGAMSATDENVNMSGSDFEDTYNTTKTISIQAMSMMNIVMLLVIFAAIIIAVKFMGKVS